MGVRARALGRWDVRLTRAHRDDPRGLVCGHRRAVRRAAPAVSEPPPVSAEEGDTFLPAVSEAEADRRAPRGAEGTPSAPAGWHALGIAAAVPGRPPRSTPPSRARRGAGAARPPGADELTPAAAPAGRDPGAHALRVDRLPAASDAVRSRPGDRAAARRGRSPGRPAGGTRAARSRRAPRRRRHVPQAGFGPRATAAAARGGDGSIKKSSERKGRKPSARRAKKRAAPKAKPAPRPSARQAAAAQAAAAQAAAAASAAPQGYAEPEPEGGPRHKGTPLGELLIERGLVSEDQLREALTTQTGFGQAPRQHPRRARSAQRARARRGAGRAAAARDRRPRPRWTSTATSSPSSPSTTRGGSSRCRSGATARGSRSRSPTRCARTCATS